jgi:hypothetical protein
MEKHILGRIFGPEKQDIPEVQLKLNSWISHPLKMKELHAFKMQGTDCPLTQHHIPEEWSHQ